MKKYVSVKIKVYKKECLRNICKSMWDPQPFLQSPKRFLPCGKVSGDLWAGARETSSSLGFSELSKRNEQKFYCYSTYLK